MDEMNAVSLRAIVSNIARVPKVVLWQTADSLAFVAAGRADRSEFHVDPSDEVMLMLKGEMRLHYLTPQGEEKVALIREGEIVHCPAGTPHSPHFPPDAAVLVLERKRRPDEIDRFMWFCPRCRAKVYEDARQVRDYNEDPVGRAYEAFYASAAHRTCAGCGHITPVPA